MNPDALIAKYEGLLKSRPDDELLHFSLGKALYDAGRISEAESQLRTALELKQDWMIMTRLPRASFTPRGWSWRSRKSMKARKRNAAPHWRSWGSSLYRQG